MTDLNADLKAYRQDQRLRTAVIEECAKVAENGHGAIGDSIAAAIRKLKSKDDGGRLQKLVDRITPENRHEEF